MLNLDFVAEQIFHTAVRFIDRADAIGLDDEHVARLRFILANHGLVALNRAVRPALIAGWQRDRKLDRTPFWLLVDATGFWEDAQPTTWHLMSAETRQRRLQWALDCADELNRYIDRATA